MNYNFSEQVSHLHASAIREILKFTVDPEVTSFAAGNPAPEAFPVEDVQRIAKELFEQEPINVLQYGITEGYTPLRNLMKARMQAQGNFKPETEELIITSGAQQVMELACKSLCDPGDTLIAEAPSFIGSLNAFKSYNVNLVGVPLDDEGMDPVKLEEALKANPNTKLIYLIPNFQNPTGLSYSQEVHDKVVEIIKNSNVMILEDNPYRELRFAGTATNSFGAELGEQACMLGTFSKIVTPGMRIGWICVRNKALRDKLLSYKATADLHTNIFSQMVLAQYLADNDVDAHIEKTKQLYKQKAELMMDCLRKYLPAGVTFTPTQGGMFLWVSLPEGMTAVELYRKALDKGVAICPGDPFYETERNVRTFRINYSNSTDEAIETGIKILGEVCAEMLNA